MNRKFQHFQKIEKPVITKNFNIHKFDWWMGIISSPIFCQTSSYYSNSRQKKKNSYFSNYTLKKKKKNTHTHPWNIDFNIIELFQYSFFVVGFITLLSILTD